MATAWAHGLRWNMDVADILANVAGQILPSRSAPVQPRVGSDPAAARPYYLSALARLDRGDRAGAIELLMQALEIDDFLLDAYHALAVVHDQQKNLPLSLFCYEELIWRFEHDPRQLDLSGEPLSVMRARARIAALREAGVEPPG